MTDTGIEKILDEMTLNEQVALLSGEDFWSLPAIARVGIGKLRVTDGPNGARGGGSLIGGVKSAAFPVGIALGATWDPEFVREIGGALAEEAKSKGAHGCSARLSTSSGLSPTGATSNASPGPGSDSRARGCLC